MQDATAVAMLLLAGFLTEELAHVDMVALSGTGFGWTANGGYFGAPDITAFVSAASKAARAARLIIIRLRKNIAARTIQRVWRRKSNDPNTELGRKVIECRYFELML